MIQCLYPEIVFVCLFAARPDCGLVAIFLPVLPGKPDGSAGKINSMQQFKIGDQVVHASYGLGRVATLQTKQLLAGEAKLYYEVVTAKNTVWVPVESANPATLRSITGKADLAHFSQVLKSKPNSLNEDRRMRQIDLNERLKPGSFGVMCEVVRDLTALSWRKPLRDADAELLRRVYETLSNEWAVAAGISARAAGQQIDALIGESKQAFLAQ